MGKRGPKKRIDLEAVWEMRKRVDRRGESKRAAARELAQGQPYSWETLRKWYSELEEAGELPTQPQVDHATREVVRRQFRKWHAGLQQERESRERISERLREVGIDPECGELSGLARQILSRLSTLEPLAKASPAVAGHLASRMHSNEQAALEELQAARVEHGELEEKHSLIVDFLEADNNVKVLTRKLYPESG